MGQHLRCACGPPLAVGPCSQAPPSAHAQDSRNNCPLAFLPVSLVPKSRLGTRDERAETCICIYGVRTYALFVSDDGVLHTTPESRSVGFSRLKCTVCFRNKCTILPSNLIPCLFVSCHLFLLLNHILRTSRGVIMETCLGIISRGSKNQTRRCLNNRMIKNLLCNRYNKEHNFINRP